MSSQGARFERRAFARATRRGDVLLHAVVHGPHVLRLLADVLERAPVRLRERAERGLEPTLQAEHERADRRRDHVLEIVLRGAQIDRVDVRLVDLVADDILQLRCDFGAVLGRVDDVAHDLLAPLGQAVRARGALRVRHGRRRRKLGPQKLG